MQKKLLSLILQIIAAVIGGGAILFAVVGLTGCGIVTQTAAEKVAENPEEFAAAIRLYCEQNNPQSRAALRDAVNVAAEPIAKVCIECASDPDDSGCHIADDGVAD